MFEYQVGKRVFRSKTAAINFAKKFGYKKVYLYELAIFPTNRKRR